RLDALPRSESAGGPHLRRPMASARRIEAVVMSDARTAILGRVDRALRTARIPASDEHLGGARAFPASALPQGERATARPAGGARAFQASGSGGDLLERFLREARALGVHTFVEATPEGVRDRLATIIAGLRVLS